MMTTLSALELCKVGIEAQTKVMEAALAYRKNHLVFDIYSEVVQKLILPEDNSKEV